MDKETFNFCKDVFHLVKDRTINITDSDLTRAGAVSMEDVYWILRSCNPERILTCILDDATQVIRQEKRDDIIKGVCKELGIKEVGGDYWSDEVAELVNELVPIRYDKSVLLSKRYKVNLFIERLTLKGQWLGMKRTARALDKVFSDTCNSKYKRHALRSVFSEDSLKRYDNNTSVVLTANLDLSDIIHLAQKITEAAGSKRIMTMSVRNFHLGIYDFGARLYRGAVVKDINVIIPVQCIKGTYPNDLGFKHQPMSVDGIDPAYPVLTKSKHVPKTIIRFF